MPLRKEILNASILIVDDQQANIDLLEQLLKEAGYRWITSTLNPHVVTALHRANHYDLILLDLVMPEMDGFRVMEDLKQSETDDYIPILVVTAHSDHKLLALASGAKDFISKPFDLIEVKTRIHNMLEVRLLYKYLKQHNEALRVYAMHDALTGLPNRRLLMDRLTLALAHSHRSATSIGIMYLDLDGFKEVNDSLGHDAGDTLLKRVADRLTHAIRDEDTVARLGGDEFVVLLSELSDIEAAEGCAAKVIESISQPYSIQGKIVNITISAGVAIYPQHGTEAETLIRNADRALYEAKDRGKNCYYMAHEGQLERRGSLKVHT